VTQAEGGGCFGCNGGASGIVQKAACRYAAKGLTYIDMFGSLLAECDVTLGSTTTISWSTNDLSTGYIGYLAMAGLSAKRIEYAARTSNGPPAVAGAGFTPSSFLALGGYATGGPPSTRTDGYVIHSSFGSKSDATRWTTVTNRASDQVGFSLADHFQTTSAIDAFVQAVAALPTITLRADLTTWDAAGLTMT